MTGHACYASEVSPADAHRAYRSIRFFSNLDGLRFICISMVLWHHAPPIDIPWLKLEDRGFLGVDFFFVLSGFLITTLLLREAVRDGSFSLRDFYIRRAVRIIPVYFFVISCVAAYYIVLKGERQYIDILPYYYLFLSNFIVDDIPTLSPTWSLAVEEQYYLIWPLLLMLLPPRWIVPILCVLIAGNVLIMIPGFPGPNPIPAGPLLLKMPNSTYAPILMGSLLAVFLHDKAVFEKLWAVTSHWFAPVLGVAALIVAMELLPHDLRGVPNFVVHTLMTFVLATLVVRERNLFTPLLTQTLVTRVGVISYGIYLYHLLALDITNRALAAIGVFGPWVLLFGYTAVSCVLADISFRTLEAYFRRFRPRPRATPDPTRSTRGT
ncbi:MAG: acyltransferase [Pseudomonadota bacterium]